MPDSPISATPYEVLGVSPMASFDELRRAYRRMLRETHPDTGGNPVRFHAVQHAWELIGTPADRAAYDRSGRRDEPAHAPWAARPARARRDSRPLARSYGHPGGWRRERYLVLMREWVGRGATLDDPYDAALVRSAPRELRHLLADALAEEATARALSALGIAFTVWHDVATDPDPSEKLDHIVLGPAGVFAILSEDWGAPVRARKGELIGENLEPGEQPFKTLSARARAVSKAARVKFTALVVVVPDDATDAALTVVGKTRGVPTVLVRLSRLPEFMRTGLPDARPVGGTELFELRSRLQASIQFV